MSDAIIVAIIGFCGSALGSFLSIIVANKLMQYRIEKLEEAMKENSQLVPRVYELEKHNEIQDTKIKAIEDDTDRIIEDIRDIKRVMKNAT